MDTYVPKRLIDTNILSQLIHKNSVSKKANSRLLSYTTQVPIPLISKNTLQLEKRIDKLKDNALYKMTPSIINGILFVSICLLIYFVLYYKFNKKKNKGVSNYAKRI